MKKETHLNIFDFDETLFRVPSYTCSEAKGKTPYEWFDSPESLDEKFNIKGIANVIEVAQSNATNYLITHRVTECSDIINQIIKKNNLNFNYVFFMGRKIEKSTIALALIENNHPDTLTIYEDSLWEIIKYTEMIIEFNLNINVNFIFIDKSKALNITLETAIQLYKTTQVERIRIV